MGRKPEATEQSRSGQSNHFDSVGKEIILSSSISILACSCSLLSKEITGAVS